MNTKLTIRQLIDKYLSERDFSDTTLITYRRVLPYFFNYLSIGGNMLTPQKSDVISWKRELKKRGLSTSTIDLYVVSIKGFFRWLKENDIYENIVGSVRIETRHIYFKKKILSPDQVKALLSSICNTDPVSLRDKAMINLMYTCGLRCVEISRLNVTDLDIHASTIMVQGKGFNGKIPASIAEETWMLITDYIQHRIDQGEDVCNNSPMFLSHLNVHLLPTRLSARSVGDVIKSRLKKFGQHSRGMSAHSLRHSAAVALIKSGATLYDVSIFLRHSNIETSRHYTRYVEAEKLSQNRPQNVLQQGIL
jgi:integrase/recombinase XerD